jgi:quinol monooxygenase YgiN
MSGMISYLTFLPLSKVSLQVKIGLMTLSNKPGVKVSVGILAQMKANPGKEAAVEAFLKEALPLANEESGTTVWFAIKLDPSTFGIFDAFADEAGRNAHLTGQIAAALMDNAAELLSEAPSIRKVDVLAAKLLASS